MMNIEPPWWWIVLFFLLMIPILPFFIINRLTKEKIKPLNWIVYKYVEHVIERILM